MLDTMVTEEEIEEDTMEDLYLLFSIEDRTYGLDLQYMIEIISYEKITEIDNMPLYVKGVINLRGKIIPVIDVRLRFKREQKAYNEFTCIVIVKLENLVAGIIVDAVQDIIKIPKNNLETTPSFGNNTETWCIDNLGKVQDKVIMLLNLRNFIYYKDMEILENTFNR